MVVVVDVGLDLLPCLVDGFTFGAPGAALLELTEPGLNERLGLGVAVAAATVRDAAGGEVLAEVSGRELAAVIETVALGADRRDDRVVGEPLGVANAEVLNSAVAVIREL